MSVHQGSYSGFEPRSLDHLLLKPRNYLLYRDSLFRILITKSEAIPSIDLSNSDQFSTKRPTHVVGVFNAGNLKKKRMFSVRWRIVVFQIQPQIDARSFIIYADQDFRSAAPWDSLLITVVYPKYDGLQIYQVVLCSLNEVTE